MIRCSEYDRLQPQTHTAICSWKWMMGTHFRPFDSWSLCISPENLWNAVNWKGEISKIFHLFEGTSECDVGTALCFFQYHLNYEIRRSCRINFAGVHSGVDQCFVLFDCSTCCTAQLNFYLKMTRDCGFLNESLILIL